ncbi:MAG: SMI1/KNR4 family protein [Paracoccaceae bacterium]
MLRPGFQAYLAQFRALSEAYWSTHVERSLEYFRERDVGGATWAADTAWKPGMSQAEIDAIEQSFGAKFPEEYRAFLATLNAANKPAIWYLFKGDTLHQAPPRHIFTDWVDGIPDIKRTYDDLIAGILFDVETNAFWQDDWGDRPSDPDKQRDHVIDLFDAAPKLIPLHSHRFLVAGLDLEPAPVLSVMQTDVIYYADCIEDCLAADFPDLAPGLEPSEITIDEQACFSALRAVPFWGSLLS